ncbi:MAG: non-homologous end-joining DNA ligase [Methylocella sp.]
MAKRPAQPQRPRARKTDVASERVSSRAIVPKPADPKQPGLFDHPLPKWIPPCLPTLVAKPPSGEKWTHEIKWDGYRVSAYVAGGNATIRTRNGFDWTPRFPAIAGALLLLPIQSAVIDGEAVILDAAGRSNFAELQAAIKLRGGDVMLYAFDLLFLDGEDLREKPLEERRAALSGIIRNKPPILLSEEYGGDGAAMFKIVCENELEGIVSKRLDRPYRSGPSKDWLKTKCVQSGEFVVIGYEPSAAVQGAVAKLLLAAKEPEGLRYVGGVGTGFSAPVSKELKEGLDFIRTEEPAICGLKHPGAVWTRPVLNIEAGYRGWTGDRLLRAASFKGVLDT